MESLNHDMNDMDELFRRAAEGYPLKARDGDWKKVSGKLLSKTEEIASAKKSKRRKYFGLLLLFFLITSASLVYYTLEYGSIKDVKIENKNERNLRNENKVKGNNANKVELNNKDKIDDRDEDKVADNNEKKVNDKNAIAIIDKEHDSTINFPTTSTAVNKKHTSKAEAQNQLSSIRVSIADRERGVTEFISKANKPPERVEGDRFHRQLVDSNGHFTNQRFILLLLRTPFHNHISVSGKVPFDDSVFSLHLLKIQSAINSLADTFIINRSRDEIADENNRGLYLGLTGGPDLSIVKSQHVDKMGYNIGLLFGYRFNKKLSLESGVLWNRKKYYSDGKYFSMSKVGPMMPSSMKILAVNGQFTIFQLPLKLKYDFTFRKKSNLFISTGILSNIYLKELNNYLTEMNGVQEHHVGLYKDVSYSWASLVSINAGYEYGIGKSQIIRVGPYIEIPLKKVGMGSMPVLSTGLNVAFTNLFSRKAP